MADEMRVRVVDRADDGRGWAVRDAQGSAPIATARLKEAAVAQATSDLRSSGGGELHIFYGDGRLETVRKVSTLTPSALTTGNAVSATSIIKQLDDEGETVDAGLELIVAVLSLGIVSGASALMSPEVSEAAGDGWMAVFFATLTWSLGCAAAVILVVKSGLIGMPLATAVLLGFAASLALAKGIGTGVLDIEAGILQAPQLPGALRGIAAFAEVALRTYGPVGALIGGGVGAWVGHRASALFPEDFLR